MNYLDHRISETFRDYHQYRFILSPKAQKTLLLKTHTFNSQLCLFCFFFPVLLQLVRLWMMAFSDHRQGNVNWCLCVLVLSACPRESMFVVCRRQTRRWFHSMRPFAACKSSLFLWVPSQTPSSQWDSFIWSEKAFFFLHVYAILCQGDDGILPF